MNNKELLGRLKNAASKQYLLYAYCDGCGRRIKVGEYCYETGDRLNDAEYSGLTFCSKCCNGVNTMQKWERYVESQGG